MPERIAIGGLVNGTACTYEFNTVNGVTTLDRLAPDYAPFAGYTGIVRTAIGDFNGDGTPDTAFVAGPGGGSMVRVLNGINGADLLSGGVVTTYESQFTGGLFAAAGDITGDGKAELVLSPDVTGGARVQVFSIVNGQLVARANFFGIDDPAFRGGARVAVGDINGDGVADLAVTAGFGGGPRVALFDGRSIAAGAVPTRLTNDFFAFPGEDAVNLRNGSYVALGDLNGDGRADLIFGAGSGGSPRVYVLDGATTLFSGATSAQANALANFFVGGNATQRSGVRVAVADIDGDGRADLITASGDNMPSRIRAYTGAATTASRGAEPRLAGEFDPLGSTALSNGVFIG